MIIDGNTININKGDTGTIRFVFSHNRIPSEVGTRQFRLIIKKDKDAADNSAIFNQQKAGTSSTVNYVTFTLSNVTTNKKEGSYYWGLRYTYSGNIKTIKEGILNIKQGPFIV